MDEQHKKEFETLIAKTLMSNLSEGKISYEDARETARFILREISTYLDKPVNFLQLLSSKWPMFEPIFTQQSREKQYSDADNQKIEALKKQLLTFAGTQTQ